MDERSDENWFDEGDDMGVWEHQGRPLAVAALASALSDLESELPIEIEYFDGSATRALQAVHIDLRGSNGRVTSVVITVA